MFGAFLPAYALPVCILLSVPYIFLNNSYFPFYQIFYLFSIVTTINLRALRGANAARLFGQS